MLSGINVGTIGYDIAINGANHCNVGALVAASVMGYVGAQQAANMIRNPTANPSNPIINPPEIEPSPIQGPIGGSGPVRLPNNLRLYRSGGSQGPAAPRILGWNRSDPNGSYDLILRNGIVYRPNGRGGVSTQSIPDRLSNPIWYLSEGTELPAGLGYVRDGQTHHSIFPLEPMPLEDFLNLWNALRWIRYRGNPTT